MIKLATGRKRFRYGSLFCDSVKDSRHTLRIRQNLITFSSQAQYVIHGLAIVVNSPQHTLCSGNSRLAWFLRNFNSWCALELTNFVDHAESGLCLACHQVGSDSEDIDSMARRIKLIENGFINIVGCYDLHVGEIFSVALAHLRKECLTLKGERSKIP